MKLRPESPLCNVLPKPYEGDTRNGYYCSGCGRDFSPDEMMHVPHYRGYQMEIPSLENHILRESL